MALGQSLELIAGPQPAISYLSLAPGDDVQGYQALIENALPPDHVALILVDMAGGTPWNTAVRIAGRYPGVRVVSGVNLSMLLEVALARQDETIEDLARMAHDAGREAIRVYN